MRPLIAGFVICLALLAACGEDEEEPSGTSPAPTNASAFPASRSPPTATSLPTATLSASPTPEFEDFREFASQVQAAFDAGDTDFFLNNAVLSSMECPNQLTDCGLPYPTVIQGILVGLWQSEGGVVPVEDFRLDLESYFQSGPEVQAIAGLYHDMGGAIGGPAFFVVVTTPRAPEMTAKVLEFINDNGIWRFQLYLNTGRTESGNEWLSGTCAECYDYWELWQGATE